MKNLFNKLKNQKLINIQVLSDGQLFLEFNNYNLAIYSEYFINFNDLKELKDKTITNLEEKDSLFILVFQDTYELQVNLMTKKDIVELMVLNDLKDQIYIVWENE